MLPEIAPPNSNRIPDGTEGCPLDIQYELLGHETKTVASGYGHGSPVPLLRKWLDKVGF